MMRDPAFDRMHSMERRMDASRRRMRRFAIVNQVVFWTIFFGVFAGLGWCIAHPRNVGAFFGDIVAGFDEAA